jgi:MFS family permease
MYTQLRDSLQRAGASAGGARPERLSVPRVHGRVLALGLTSLFTDISSEAVSSVLPLYFLVALRFTPFTFGLIDGLNQGAAALVSVGGGLVADRWRRFKDVAVVGYALSAIARFGLLAAGGSWPVLTGVISIDRIGKGIRTAPRDAMIAASSSPEALGIAFGVHRALDTLGALIGPVVAFAILNNTANAFDAVFVVSCCAALIGLGILLFFVENDTTAARSEVPRRPARRREERARPVFSLRAAAALATMPRFGIVLLVSGALSLATISDSFLYLVLQRGMHFSIGFFPLLFVGTSLAYFVLAVPAGWVADRIGTGRVFVAGYVVLLLVYTAFLRGSFGAGATVLYLAAFGAYYAMTDGVLRAHASTLLPPALRTSGLGLLTTITGLASLFGSIAFGALWTWQGPHFAVTCFFIALGLATALATLHMAINRAAPSQAAEELPAA